MKMSSLFMPTTFLELRGSYNKAKVVLLGCPMDTTSSYRPGSRFAPRAIREGPIAIETYSPSLRADL